MLYQCQLYISLILCHDLNQWWFRMETVEIERSTMQQHRLPSTQRPTQLRDSWKMCCIDSAVRNRFCTSSLITDPRCLSLITDAFRLLAFYIFNFHNYDIIFFFKNLYDDDVSDMTTHMWTLPTSYMRYVCICVNVCVFICNELCFHVFAWRLILVFLYVFPMWLDGFTYVWFDVMFGTCVYVCAKGIQIPC